MSTIPTQPVPTSLLDFRKGDALYVVRINLRSGESDEPRLCLIEKVGREWITVRLYSNSVARFDRHTGMHDAGRYVSSYRAYVSEQAYHDEQERLQLEQEIRSYFTYGRRNSLTLLREIKRLLEQ